MTWYYLNAAGDRVACPEKDLPVLVGAGEIHARSLVWHRGRDSWTSAGEVRPELFQPSGTSGGQLAELGRPEVVALVAAGRVRPGSLRIVAFLLFVVAASMLVSLFLLPICWIPGIMGALLLRAAADLESAEHAGELQSWHRFGISLVAFWRWAAIALGLAAALLLAASLLVYLLNAGFLKTPDWLLPPPPEEEAATVREGG